MYLKGEAQQLLKSIIGIFDWIQMLPLQFGICSNEICYLILLILRKFSKTTCLIMFNYCFIMCIKLIF